MPVAVLFASLLLGLLSISSCTSPAQPPRVIAAASIARMLAEAGLDRDITVIRGASKTLEMQVLEGLACDVVLLLSPLDPKALLSAKKITPESVREVGTFGLSLASSGTSNVKASLIELRTLPGRIAIANPETAPFGMAAKQALTSLGLWDELASRLVVADDVALAQRLVDHGEVAFAFVPTPSVSNPRTFAVPAGLHQPLRVWGALTPRATKAGVEFWERISTRESGDALSGLGLQSPENRGAWAIR